MQDSRRTPTAIRGIHPREAVLDCYHPALRTVSGEIWYAECLQCWSESEAKNMATVMLAMTPSPLDRMIKYKAQGPFMEIIDYTPQRPKRPRRLSLVGQE